MNALTTTDRPMNTSLSLLMDPLKFDHLQRVGKMLALSPLFPEHLRKGGMEGAIANGALVLNMANRLNEDPLTVAQNIYFVGGRPGWNTTYMIAKANQAGVFRDPIDWEVTGKGDSLTVTAFGIIERTGKRVEVTLDMETAKKEGWTKNPKYQSIPGQMLRYRTAAFLIRLYCPEVMIGLPAQIEQELEMRDITPPEDMPQATPEKAATKAAEQEPIEAKAEPVKQEAEKTAAKAAPKAEAQTAKPKETAPAKREEPKPAAATEDDQFRGLLRMMLADLEQSGPEETLSVYGPQIEAMKASAPGIFAEWQKALIAARKAQESAAPEDAAEPAQDAGPDPYGTPLGKTFLKDCADMGFDAAMDFHDAAMDALQGANPALWRAIMDEAKRIDPMAQGD